MGLGSCKGRLWAVAYPKHKEFQHGTSVSHPGWLIVVAGHTDITGDARANQILSLKRAEALRDWMLSTSDVSPTCFAVQGYGATRPIATNDTAEGRAANRRVEISLVPQANACQATASQSASGSEAATTPSKEN